MVAMDEIIVDTIVVPVLLSAVSVIFVETVVVTVIVPVVALL